jgi:hypothetical protein
MAYRSTTLMLRDVAREEGVPWPTPPESLGFPPMVACHVCGASLPIGETWISDQGDLTCRWCLLHISARVEIEGDSDD